MTSDVVLAAVVTGVLGVVATITAAIITARAKDRGTSDLISELTALRNLSVKPADQDFRVRVTEPRLYGEIRSQAFDVHGTFGYVPAGYQIWLATFGVHRVNGRGWGTQYWPQHPAADLSYTSDGNIWTAHINNIGGEHDEQRLEFAVLMVGPNGQALFNYCVKAGLETGRWPSISQLTSDIVECAKSTVTFRLS